MVTHQNITTVSVMKIVAQCVMAISNINDNFSCLRRETFTGEILGTPDNKIPKWILLARGKAETMGKHHIIL